MNSGINSSSPIGVFDSGIGGLTVLKELEKQLPNESFIYFGDTARVPYGTKSKATIVRYTRQIIRFLRSQSVKAIVIACNTASAYALDEAVCDPDIPLLGVVRSGAETAARVTKSGRIGIIATNGTINSGVHQKIIETLRPDAQVFGQPCPLFVPLAEEGMLNDPVTDEMVRRYLSPLVAQNVDTLILGCTHYPLLRPAIADFMGSAVSFVDPADETIRELKRLLDDRGLLAQNCRKTGSFYVSDSTQNMYAFAKLILGRDVPEITLLDPECLGQ